MKPARTSFGPSMLALRRSHGLSSGVLIASGFILFVVSLGLGGRSRTLAALVATALIPASVWLFAKRPPRAELAIGLAAIGGVHIVVDLTGGVARSPLHPLVYVVVAIAIGLFPAGAALGTVLVAVLVELSALFFERGLDASAFLAHLGLMALFASLFAVLFGAEARALRKRGEDEVLSTLLRIEQDARDFRLIGASLGPESSTPRDREAAHRARRVGSVRAIRESLVDILEVGRLATRADAAMLFLLNDDGTRLKLKECVSPETEPSLIERVLPAAEGPIGAVAKTGRIVNLLPKPGGAGLGYRPKSPVGSFLGLPVFDGSRLVGVLAVDREAALPFSEHDEEVLEAVAREILRAMESERIFVLMDQTKYEQDRLYEAFALLNEALAIDVVAESLLEATLRIKKLEFGCVTLFDADKALHTIVRLRAPEAELEKALVGAVFPDNDASLVTMALKNGHPLPYVPLSEQLDRARLRLFGEWPHPELESIKVFPLQSRGRPLGTLMMGSTDARRELTREEERMIALICSHGAATLANALMFQQVEQMATRDALTGLVNRRRFNELLNEALARAIRFDRKVSVMMIDADHFKSINDTYGHPVGDLVLKRIALLITSDARRTDVAGRYGGEEFIVILDETDAAGAALVAERLRERMQSEVIQGDFGRVKVTASFGVACWPDHASTAEALLEHADQALYEAKRKGRNRVVTWRGAHCPPGDRPAIRQGERASEAGPSQARN